MRTFPSPAALAWRVFVAATALGALACDPTTDQSTPTPVRLLSIDEDGPEIRPRGPLPTPVTVQVVDAKGNPVPRVRIVWRATNGLLTRGVSISDTGGIAGTGITALAAGVTAVSAVAGGVDSLTRTFEVVADEATSLAYDRFVPVTVPAFNGIPEIVHPDLADFPGRPGRRLAVTPYPGGSFYDELPSLFESGNDLDWSLPVGGQNPLAPAPTNGGNLSDPDLLYNPDADELWLYYRFAGGENVISLIRSQDGIRWTLPETVVITPNHEAISPTVVRRGPRDWWMWVVNGGAEGCFGARATVELRRSGDGIHWGPPIPITMPAEGLFPWHLEVQWIPTRGEFWALYPAKEAGSCATPVLYLATSRDGYNWARTPAPVAIRGVRREFKDVVYRSTFRYDADRDDVWLWISGARRGHRAWRWTTMVVRRTRTQLMGAPSSSAGAISAPPASPYLMTRWP